MQTLRFIVISVVALLAGCGDSSDPEAVPGDTSLADAESSDVVVDSYVADTFSDGGGPEASALDASDADAADADASDGDASDAASCDVGPCSSCPAVEPAGDSACSAPGLLCSYSNTCGGNDKASCTGGKWALSDVCCPATVPVEGSGCLTEGAHCSWPHGCGAFGDAFDRATCKDLHWSVMPSPCP